MTNDIQSRIDKMATWAAKVEKQLAELQSNVNGNSQPLDDLDAQIVEALAKPDYADEILDRKNDIIGTETNLTFLDDTISELESNAYLDVSAELDDKGKPKHSNDAQRKAAVKAVLAGNDEYKQAIENKRVHEASVAKLKAEIDYYESLRKETHYHLRAMMARIENQTARLMTTATK